MGVDFLRRVAKSFDRALDKQAVELRTPTLFTHGIKNSQRSALASLDGDISVNTGEQLFVRLLNAELVAQKGTLVVGVFRSPPDNFSDVVKQSGGICIGEVKTMHPFSRTAEVSLCE